MAMVNSRDLKSIRRGCTNKDVSKALVGALKSGIRYRMTKSGVMLYGDNGRCVVAHFTSSDHRAAANLKAELRSMGLPQKGTK